MPTQAATFNSHFSTFCSLDLCFFLLYQLITLSFQRQTSFNHFPLLSSHSSLLEFMKKIKPNGQAGLKYALWETSALSFLQILFRVTHTKLQHRSSNAAVAFSFQQNTNHDRTQQLVVMITHVINKVNDQQMSFIRISELESKEKCQQGKYLSLMALMPPQPSICSETLTPKLPRSCFLSFQEQYLCALINISGVQDIATRCNASAVNPNAKISPKPATGRLKLCMWNAAKVMKT